MYKFFTLLLVALPVLCPTALAKEYLYIHNTNSGEISKISIPEHEVVGTIEIGLYMDFVTKSPDNKTLYVSESAQHTLWAYDLSPKGDISNKRLLIKFDGVGTDGIRCDAKGNIYATLYGKGVVAVISPTGKQLRNIPLGGKNPSNIAFGGPDGKTCYVTIADKGCIDTFRTDTPGRSFVMWK